MKKVFTLVLGALVALTTIAAPLNLRKAGKKELTKETVLNHVKKIAPKAPAQLNGETITIEANNLNVDASYNAMMYAFFEHGYVYVGGNNEEWFVEATLLPDSLEYFTTYSSADSTISLSVYDVEDTEIELTVSAAELKTTAKGNQFTATGVDEDGNTYNINLTLFAPDEPKAVVTIAFDSCGIEDYTDDYGFYMIASDKGDTAVQVAMISEPEAGTFTTNDFETYYTAVLVFDEEEEKFAPVTEGFFTITATIAETETGKDIHFELFATDSILYKVNFTYTKPVAKETVQIELENAYFEDFRDDDGSIYLYAAPADSSYVFSLNPYSEEIEGEFTVEDLVAGYSFIKKGDKFFSFAEGEFTVELGDDNILTWEGWVLATDNVKYEFVIKTAPIEVEGIENIELTEKAKKVVVDGAVYIVRDNKIYNILGTQVR